MGKIMLCPGVNAAYPAHDTLILHSDKTTLVRFEDLCIVVSLLSVVIILGISSDSISKYLLV